MEEEIKVTHPFIPFENIALCLSGGGFRAASFSLGTLSYLQSIKLDARSLLSRIKYISSTSGGTITNLMYSAALCICDDEDKSFSYSFEKLYNGMSGEGILQRAVDLLADDAFWSDPGTTKTRNVINAFSIVYDRELFAGKNLGVFLDKQKTRDLSVCFNATEFVHGITFRFQLDRGRSIYKLVGNKYIYFDAGKAGVLGRVKLADVLAASSCFPAGFEPIMFPGDFTSSTLTADELKNSLITENYDGVTGVLDQEMALMDGGVTDNQALYSAMNANGRRGGRDKPPFDLFIVTDVTSYFMKPYAQPAGPVKPWQEDSVDDYLSGVRKISSVYRGVRTGFIAALLIAVAIFFFPANEYLRDAGYILLGAGILGTAILIGIEILATKSNLLKTVIKHPEKLKLSEILRPLNPGGVLGDEVTNRLVDFMEHVKLKTICAMIMNRIRSVVTMSVEVNLKHGRRLIFELFYKNTAFDNRRLPNFIYELGAGHVFERRSKYDDPRQPASGLSTEDKAILLNAHAGLVTMAEEARNMGTTLWFGAEDMRNKMPDKIIQCGQFTTCVNLLEYTMVLIMLHDAGHVTIPQNLIDPVRKLKTDLLEDWVKFNETPDFLLKENLNYMATSPMTL